DDEVGARRVLAQHRQQSVGIRPWRIVTVLTPRRMAVPGKVHGQRRLTETDDHGVPSVRVLPAAVQKDNAWGSAAPAQRAGSALRGADLDPRYVGQRTRDTGLLGVLGQ